MRRQLGHGLAVVAALLGMKKETLSRLLPSGLAAKLRQERRDIGETERVVVTVLMSDIRSYSTIAEHADPSQLAGQLNTHRAAMNHAILGEEEGETPGTAPLPGTGDPDDNRAQIHVDHERRVLRQAAQQQVGEGDRADSDRERQPIGEIDTGLAVITGDGGDRLRRADAPAQQHAHELLDEKRIALRRGEDPLSEPARERRRYEREFSRAAERLLPTLQARRHYQRAVDPDSTT